MPVKSFYEIFYREICKYFDCYAVLFRRLCRLHMNLYMKQEGKAGRNFNVAFFINEDRKAKGNFFNGVLM